MHTKTKQPSAGQLAQARQGFDRWRRRSRKRRRRIPDRLWQMAAEAASVHGVHATARELRLNSTRLKEQLHALGQGQASEETPGFVEFPWMGAAPVPECILEAEDQAGRKLRVHLKGSATAQAASLGRMLWGCKE
jgi:hypothetical protein